MLNEELRNGIAINYHYNTKSINNFDDYDVLPQYKIYPNTKKNVIKKLEVEKNSDFMQILFNRHSCRKFRDQGITFNCLGQLLSYSFGFNNMKQNGIQFRTYASAGARYPIEVYPVILNSDDLGLGVYHYNVIDNSIELIQGGNFERELNSFYSNQAIINASCYIMFSMIFERTMQKYGERGYRFLYLDAGHMGQNLYLVAEYLGLGITALGGGNGSDKTIDELLKINFCEESFFYGFAVGIPT